jgi:hypothetical protein
MINNELKKQEIIRLLVDIKTNIITNTETQYEIENIYTKDINDKKYYVCETSVCDVELDFQKINSLINFL